MTTHFETTEQEMARNAEYQAGKLFGQVLNDNIDPRDEMSRLAAAMEISALIKYSDGTISDAHAQGMWIGFNYQELPLNAVTELLEVDLP